MTEEEPKPAAASGSRERTPSEMRKDERRKTGAQMEDLKALFKRRPDNYSDVYQWLDSHLDPKHGQRGRSFFESFADVLPADAEGLGPYLESEFAHLRGKVIFGELGGTGRNAVRGFSDGFIKESYAVTLIDEAHQQGEEKWYEAVKKLDASIRHTVMEGDLRKPETYDGLRALTGGKRFTILLERLGKGLDFGPEDARTLGAILQAWYGLLDEDSIGIFQVSPDWNPLLEAFAEKVTRLSGDTLEVQVNEGPFLGGRGKNSALRIRRRPGSPARLPMLDAAEVRFMMGDDV